MYKRLFSFKPTLFYLLFGALLPATAAAQTEAPAADPFEQLQRRMEELMRRGMAFDSSFEGGRLQFSPDSNSFFYFHIDTSFNGMGDGFFDFSPFGDTELPDFFGFDRLFEQFFKETDPAAPRRGYDELPADDGQPDGADDGLLPEERLRQQEEKNKAGDKPDKPAKRKVQTIRI